MVAVAASTTSAGAEVLASVLGAVLLALGAGCYHYLKRTFRKRRQRLTLWQDTTDAMWGTKGDDFNKHPQEGLVEIVHSHGEDIDSLEARVQRLEQGGRQ